MAAPQAPPGKLICLTNALLHITRNHIGSGGGSLLETIRGRGHPCLDLKLQDFFRLGRTISPGLGHMADWLGGRPRPCSKILSRVRDLPRSNSSYSIKGLQCIGGDTPGAHARGGSVEGNRGRRHDSGQRVVQRRRRLRAGGGQRVTKQLGHNSLPHPNAWLDHLSIGHPGQHPGRQESHSSVGSPPRRRRRKCTPGRPQNDGGGGCFEAAPCSTVLHRGNTHKIPLWSNVP
eukprot:gene12452-biopygen12480